MIDGSLGIGLAIMLIIFSGAMLGMLIGGLLPDHHVSSDTKAAISISMAVVGTMTALVLGLLISSANSSFSTRAGEVTALSADLIRMDRLLNRYGPEAKAARDALQLYTAMKLNDLFPQQPDQKSNVDNPATVDTLEHMQDLILALRPSDDRQHWLTEQALLLAAQVSQTRWFLVEQSSGSLPAPFLILVVFWLTILFASFGLFAPRNVTVTLALLLCSMAVAGGIEMVLQMESPLEGIVRISSTPLRHAAEVIGH